MTGDSLRYIGLPGLPEFTPGMRLAPQILKAARTHGVVLTDGDVILVAQKIVSKAEGRLVRLSDVTPSAFARRVAAECRADGRFVELVLRESRRIVRMNERLLITETHHGFICANAGVDRSNVPGDDCVSLLPVDPDGSARQLRLALAEAADIRPAVIITDTFGRPWRQGIMNVAIGLAGINPLEDLRRLEDDYGKVLQSTILATADELAAGAGLIMRKSSRTPVVVARGFAYEAGEHTARELLRPRELDLFR